MPSPWWPSPRTSTSKGQACLSKLLPLPCAGSSEELGLSYWLERKSIWVLPAAAGPHGPLLLWASSLSCQGPSASQALSLPVPQLPSPREHAYHPTSLAGVPVSLLGISHLNLEQLEAHTRVTAGSFSWAQESVTFLVSGGPAPVQTH